MLAFEYKWANYSVTGVSNEQSCENMSKIHLQEKDIKTSCLKPLNMDII